MPLCILHIVQDAQKFLKMWKIFVHFDGPFSYRARPEIPLYHTLQILSIGKLHKLSKKFFPEFVQNRENFFSKLHNCRPQFLFILTNFSLFCTNLQSNLWLFYLLKFVSGYDKIYLSVRDRKLNPN